MSTDPSPAGGPSTARRRPPARRSAQQAAPACAGTGSDTPAPLRVPRPWQCAPSQPAEGMAPGDGVMISGQGYGVGPTGAVATGESGLITSWSANKRDPATDSPSADRARRRRGSAEDGPPTGQRHRRTASKGFHPSPARAAGTRRAAHPPHGQHRSPVPDKVKQAEPAARSRGGRRVPGRTCPPCAGVGKFFTPAALGLVARRPAQSGSHRSGPRR